MEKSNKEVTYMCNEKPVGKWIEKWEQNFIEADRDELEKLISGLDSYYCNMISDLDVDNDTKKNLTCAMKDRTILEKGLIRALSKFKD